MKIGEKLVSNSVYLFFDWFVVTVFSLIFWLVVGKTLSTYDYGVIATSVNTVSLLSAFALVGLASAAPKLISEYLSVKNRKRADAVTTLSLKITLLTSLIIGIVLFFASGYISSVYKTPTISLQIASLTMIPASLYILSSSILQGYQDMRKIFSTDGLGYAVKAGLALVLIVVGFGFMGPLIGWLLSYLVIILLRLRYFKSLSSKGIDKHFVIFSYAIPAFIGSIIFTLLSNTPNLIVSSLEGPALAGLFALSLTITYPIAVVPGILNTALFPIVSGLMNEKNAAKRQRRLIGLVTHYTSFVVIPALILFILFSRELVLFFATQNYLGATQLIPYLAVASFFFGFGSILSQAIYAIRKPKMSQYIALLTTAIFFILVLPLTLMSSIRGTAIAYLISGIVFSFVSYIFLNKVLKFRLPLKPLSKILLSGVLVLLIGLYALNFSLIIKILLAIASLLIYVSALIPLRFYSVDDIRILQILAKKSPVFKNLFRFTGNFLSKYARESDY